jgi:hypothetical protein
MAIVMSSGALLQFLYQSMFEEDWKIGSADRRIEVLNCKWDVEFRTP